MAKLEWVSEDWVSWKFVRFSRYHWLFSVGDGNEIPIEYYFSPACDRWNVTGTNFSQVRTLFPNNPGKGGVNRLSKIWKRSIVCKHWQSFEDEVELDLICEHRVGDYHKKWHLKFSE